ncbi:MAG: hypothetical protein EOP48_12645 [Sphingobacteriales bacterium]|nr:MAG: hypothetical protein EOP48_12645 [Sphingobacteriales bacterium]
MSISREIYTYTASKQLPHLIQSLFASELLAPGKTIYLFSPWLSNVAILDNSTNSFRQVNPLWPRGVISLTSVLEHLISKGTEIRICVNHSDHNKFLMSWIDQMIKRGYSNVLGKRRKDLHKKGLLFDKGFISGSMNFTFNGLNVLDERVVFTTHDGDIASAQIEFENYWNSEENI